MWPAIGAALAVIAVLALVATVAVRRLDGSPTPTPVRASPAAPSTTTARPAAADPGRTEPGVHVQVTPRPDGTLEVVEQIRFLGASTGLQVDLPVLKGVVSGARPPDVRIADLEVLSDGQRLPQQTDSIATGGRVLLPNAPLSVELRYRLTGAATVSKPSTPGRALVVLPPIATDDSLSKLPVVVEVEGAGVRNVVCPGLATRDQLCGRRTKSGWRTITLQPDATAVLAQLDLSRY
ncbi:hypothetical protein SAMN04489867_3290 [Pedococcus dokdonensis]|uniref:Uncharacterized protein n=1 Tax=Pedococcus dokdonensis TaxID=443156 RepID=A0A1H0UFE5_9MICO|nr:hypothetical protein SAMN04489867_3290 [Pedococcus dokdonensis]